MGFAKGHKHAKGGKRPGSGRPSKDRARIKKAAAEIAKAYIEKHIEPVLKAYLQLAGGRMVKHHNTEDGRVLWEENEVDAPTLRHYIDKLVPSPKLAPTDKEGNTIPPVHYHMPSLESD